MDWLSPSACHAPLLDQPPRLAFRPGTDLGAWQRRLRRRLHHLLGLGLMPAEPGDLAVRTVWEREHPSGLGTITKIVFLAEPGAEVPAYVCLPKNAQPPFAFMICLQGHSTGMHNSIAYSEDEEHPIAVEGDRDFALGCLRQGIAAFAIEQRSLGSRREKQQARKSYHNDCHDAAARALMLGRTLAGERVYDVGRALEYLATRSDVMPNRIGIMGTSGGGITAMYAIAMFERLAFAMLSASFCTFRDSVMTIHHCIDNYVPGLYRFADMADIVGVAAPRPVLIVGAEHDQIFPKHGLERAFAQLQTIYDAAGAGDRVGLVVGPEGHRFYAELAWHAARSLWPPTP